MQANGREIEVEEHQKISHSHSMPMLMGNSMSRGIPFQMQSLSIQQSYESLLWGLEFEKVKDQYANQQQTEEQNEFECMWSSIIGNSSAQREQFSKMHQEYVPFAENEFASVQNAWELAKQFHSEGRLTEAVLAAEVAAKQQPENWEVWRLLGECHSENEMECKALAAYRKCLDLNPTCLSVLINMSVSLTNEGYEMNAVSLLNRWICKKYGFTLDEENSISREELTGFFLSALKTIPEAKSDTDLQLGLGLLKYNQFEFDKAVDCFELAVKREPKNCILWNTLGATLANSGKSEAALENYQKALSLRPGFIRARHNLAIGCINIGCYEHAASNLVKCLEIQSIGQANVSFTSEAIWETLKRCFNLMNNSELVERCSQRDIEYFVYQYSNDANSLGE